MVVMIVAREQCFYLQQEAVLIQFTFLITSQTMTPTIIGIIMMDIHC